MTDNLKGNYVAANASEAGLETLFEIDPITGLPIETPILDPIEDTEEVITQDATDVE